MLVAKPQRAPPKAYQLVLKTHKLTIFLTVHQSSTIADLKEEALSALTSTVLLSSAPGEDDMMDEGNGNTEVPRVQSTEDFELCRAVKDKGRSNAASSAVSYEILDPSTPIKGLLSNWETLCVQFRDEDGMFSFTLSSNNSACSPTPGNLLPVEVSQPSLLDEEDEESRWTLPTSESPAAVGKGKRKAPPE